MYTNTHRRGKIGIVLFILTLVTTIVIAVGLIRVTTSDETPEWAKGLVNSNIDWSPNVSGNTYMLPHGQERNRYTYSGNYGRLYFR